MYDASFPRQDGNDETDRLLEALKPVEAALAEALAQGDETTALRMARKALEVAGEMSRPPDLLPDDLAWVQALVLDFEPRLLIALADATLAVHEGFGLRIAHWSGAVEADAAWGLARRFAASPYAGQAEWHLPDAGKPLLEP